VLIDLHMHLSRWCLWKWSQSTRGLESNSPGVIVPYSIDCDAFASISADDRIAIRRASGIPDDALVFGRVGQASITKWSPLLIQAFEAVATQVPTAWLAVCGLPDRLRDMVRLLPAAVRSRVVELSMTNSDAQLRQYYGLMDVFVHASEKGESFGMVLCEAMLSGLPVITLSTPLRDNSQIEVVPHGTAGIVVSDLKQMVDGMLAMKENQPAYRSMALHAPKWVRDTYDIPVVTRRLVAIAPMVLASTSSEELARRLSDLPGDLTKAPADSYRTLLSSAGVKQKFVESLATSLVNRPTSRRAIRFVRSSQSLVKYRRAALPRPQ
jgi:glycosyltransferase involved in cell wall biosynthesis